MIYGFRCWLVCGSAASLSLFFLYLFFCVLDYYFLLPARGWVGGILNIVGSVGCEVLARFVGRCVVWL